MSRPYLSYSIEQLEAEFARAQDAGDVAAIQSLDSELAVRTTPRSRKLRQLLQEFLSPASGKRSDPKPSSRNERPSSSSTAPRIKTSGANNHTPTSQQQEAIDEFRKGQSLKINAYAGTGKTSTLQMIAHSTQRHGQYIAFNKAIVEEAKQKFPRHVNCATVHGLAYKGMASKYTRADKLTGRINANQLAETLKLKRWPIDRNHALTPRSQAYLILETIRRFCHSAEPEITAAHVPRHGSLISAPAAVLSAVTEFALHGANHVWARKRDAADTMPLGHDGYLKLWALSDPTIAADYILLDEAQDTNPVVLQVLTRQPAQLVYVGDKYQQIYEWRGAVNAMEKISTNGTTYLTRSFRFGPQIAELASSILKRMNEPRPLVGNPNVSSRIGPVSPETILARSNASTITAVIDSLDAGKKPHLVGGKDELMDMLRGVKDLKEGQQSTVPEFFGFDNWQEVVGFAKSDEGAHLLTFVNLVEARGERQLMWALNRTVDADESNLTISTAHKAKGREWGTVRLMDDFTRMNGRASASRQDGTDFAELRLFYVAVTRAKTALEIPPPVLASLR